MTNDALAFLIGLGIPAGYLAGVGFQHWVAQRKDKKGRADWVDLPSGWSRGFADGAAGHVITIDGSAFWWIKTRSGVTIEGKAKNVPEGQRELERAAVEFGVMR